MKKIRVMIVEDSPTVREILVYIINQDPRLEVVGVAESGEKALEIVDRVRPDVISMDIRLPGINGFETTETIMKIRPTPIVVVSASGTSEDLEISMNSLKAGALSVVEKPVSSIQADYEKMADKICTQLAIMSEVKVVSQRLSAKRPPALSRLASKPFAPNLKQPVPKGPFKCLGLVASTGGPKALSIILGSLPHDFPLPIFVVQHITKMFHDGFARWLETVTPLPVVQVKSPMPAAPGTVYLSAVDHHLRLQHSVVQPDQGPLVCRQRPSGTVLFKSMAEQVGSHAIGVLLTGMGEDGAQGLKAIMDAGGYTIAEDESTSVVYGMPGAAVALGGACESLPLDKIAFRILDMVSQIKNGVTIHG